MNVNRTSSNWRLEQNLLKRREEHFASCYEPRCVLGKRALSLSCGCQGKWWEEKSEDPNHLSTSMRHVLQAMYLANSELALQIVWVQQITLCGILPFYAWRRYRLLNWENVAFSYAEIEEKIIYTSLWPTLAWFAKRLPYISYRLLPYLILKYRSLSTRSKWHHLHAICVHYFSYFIDSFLPRVCRAHKHFRAGC